MFFEKIISIDDCWIWGGYVQNAGYAAMSTYRHTFLAHRWAYEYFIEKIKPRLTLDHLCKNKICVNPYHLEQVTRAENIRRSGLSGVALIESQKTHCKNGHSYAKHGVRYPNGYTKARTRKYARRCIACRGSR